MATARRGNTTRKSLLRTATKLFSERGFDAVSTREIASSVGITLPSIIHFFGSKQGLYEAVLSDVASGMESQLRPAADAALLALSSLSDRSTLIEALDHLLSTFTRTLLAGPPEWTRLLLQEQFRDSKGGASIDKIISDRVLAPLSRLVGMIRSLPPESTQVRLEVFMLLGGIVVFRTHRISPFRALKLKKLRVEDIEEIVLLQRAHIAAIFATGDKHRKGRSKKLEN